MWDGQLYNYQIKIVASFLIEIIQKSTAREIQKAARQSQTTVIEWAFYEAYFMVVKINVKKRRLINGEKEIKDLIMSICISVKVVRSLNLSLNLDHMETFCFIFSFWDTENLETRLTNRLISWIHSLKSGGKVSFHFPKNYSWNDKACFRNIIQHRIKGPSW